MGDRCYMELTCRRQDVETFEAIGFCHHEADYLGPEVATMVCEEADGANVDDMPEDIPYTGWHGPGSNYGEMEFACDGQKLRYAMKCGGELVVPFNLETNAPCERAVAQMRDYVALVQRAEALLKTPAPV